MCVCVGAMMVGSIKTTVSEGEEVKRGQEIGYFAFGMATYLSLKSIFLIDFQVARLLWFYLRKVLLNGTKTY